MNAFDDLNVDLDAILRDIKPHLVAPNLADVAAVSNAKKPKTIADMIVRGMHASIKNPVTKDIVHDGAIHKVKYFDIEPLMIGVWPIISLMLLQLSYGEQVTIIESIYPAKTQLTAKAFALTFTAHVEPTNIRIENETELVDKLDASLAGIATIISMLHGSGQPMPHPDRVNTNIELMNRLVDIKKGRDEFAQATKRAEDAARYNDRLRK